MIKIHFNKTGSHPAIGAYKAMTTATVDPVVGKYLVDTNQAAYVSEKVAAEAVVEAGTTVDPVATKKR